MRPILIALAALLLPALPPRSSRISRNPAWSASWRTRRSSPIPRNGRRSSTRRRRSPSWSRPASCRRWTQRLPQRADGAEAAAQRRQIRRHLAARLPRTGRQRERQPRPLGRQAAVLGRDRHQDRAQRRQGLGDERGRQAHDDFPAQGHEVVRRRAVHRRRFRVLVRGHVSEQGSHQIAGAGILAPRASPAA